MKKKHDKCLSMNMDRKGLALLLCVLGLTQSSYAGEVVGSSSGAFTNPKPPGATVTGVGTSYFTWGIGLSTPPSSLMYSGAFFDANLEETFKLGDLEYFNGTIWSGTEASTVDLDITVEFTTPDTIPQLSTQTLRLVNTPNTSDPTASADRVFLPTTYPQNTFTVGSHKYALSIIGFGTTTGAGFTELDNFHVLEGGTASAELIARVGRACVVPEGKRAKKETIRNIGTCGNRAKESSMGKLRDTAEWHPSN